MTHESRPTQHEQNSSQLSMEQDIELLEITIAMAERMDEQGTVDPGIRDALVSTTDTQVEDTSYSSGGKTIPGTDEWIPGERHERFNYKRTDAEGKQSSVVMPTNLAKRLQAYAAKHREEASKVAEQPKAAADTTSPPKHRRDKADKAAQPKTTTPSRARRGAHRAQSAPKIIPKPAKITPKEANTSGKLELADLVNVDTSGRAHVTGSHNPEGHSKNGQFISKHQMEQIMLHEEQIRKHLGQRAVENKVGHIDVLGRAHRDNGQMMSNKELAMLLNGSGGAYLPEQTSADKRQSNDELDKLLGGPDLSTAAPNPAASIDTNQVAPNPDIAATVVANTVDTNTAPDNTADQQPAPAARRTLKDRMLRRLSLASVYMQERMRKFGDYLSDEEKGRRRGIAVGVLGVAAVGGAMLASKYGADVHIPHGGAGATPNPIDVGLVPVPEHFALHQGDTVWGITSQLAAEHGHNLTDPEKHQMVGQILEANGLSWEDARHLPVGQYIVMPDEVREQLARAA